MSLSGFGNYHQTEALLGALPSNQNSPQHCPYGLYAEQLSGSAFTRPRATNLHSWLYRILPSVMHQEYRLYPTFKTAKYTDDQAPHPYRWSPFPSASGALDFIDSLELVAGHQHCNAYLYQCNLSMEQRYFFNADGELLFVPYAGELTLATEFGSLELKPGWIAVIPRGIKFQVQLKTPSASGYLCENFSLPLSLPNLGVMGANALANPRHFIYPEAAFEEKQTACSLLCKSQGRLWESPASHSPLNVVAWQGNYAPYAYDLSLFNTINTVSFDHPDPSIFTVLTSESNTPGVANLDFVIFPPRWMVAQHSFRPPYFHRNIMSELMGLINGRYDAKEDGFYPGGISIHNSMTAHGPDSRSYQAALNQSQKPVYLDNTLAFMFETREPWKITERAYLHPCRQRNYLRCWEDLPINFHP